MIGDWPVPVAAPPELKDACVAAILQGLREREQRAARLQAALDALATAATVAAMHMR